MEPFEVRRDRYLAAVEAALDRCVPPSSAPQHSVVDAMRYALLGGGKRVRATLTLEFCRICGGREEAAMPLACAVEMIHAYSLIHDDLPCMDDDDLRRGKPSCHIAYGEATALLAGDGLLTHAFGAAAQAAPYLKPEHFAAVIREMSRAAGTDGMIGGQVLDIEDRTEDKAQLEQMCALKTGAMIRLAARLGCYAAGADEKTLAAADEYARLLGLCFQVVDDILDVTADPAVLGKPTGSDDENGKKTFVGHYGLEGSAELARCLTAQALEQLKTLELPDPFLVQLTEKLCSRNK